MSKKKDLDYVQLKELADLIDHEVDGDLEGLRHRLTMEHGAKLAFRSGSNHVSMAGLRVSCTSSMKQALINWGNKARREALKAGQ
jgi:hypothetical protein